MHHLKQYSLCYVATPYTNYEAGHHEAFLQACLVSSALMRSGVSVFCPIAHSHPIAVLGQIDNIDHEFWMEANRPFMDKCDALIVVEMPGWKQSTGMSEETAQFFFAGKPIFHLDPLTMAVWPKAQS